MSLHISESGDQSAPTVVFLHGGGTAGWMWAQQIADLPDFHTLNVDLPGHGGSNGEPWVSLSETATQIAGIIHDRAHQGRAHLVGLSLGGYSALQVAAEFPERVESVVVSGVTASPLSLSRVTMFQLRVMNVLTRYRWFVRAQAKYMMQLPSDAVDLYAESFMAMSRETYDVMQKDIFEYHLPASLASAKMPILVVAGGAEMAAIRSGVGEVTAKVPCAKGMIAPNLHHGWNGENPPLFSAMVRAWLTGAALPSALQPV